MPGSFLSEADRKALNNFQPTLEAEEVTKYFHLSQADLDQVKNQHGAVNQLGFALQLGTLRYLGFCPDNLQQPPKEIISYLALQLNLDPAVLAGYGQRAQTRTGHLSRIQVFLAYRELKEEDYLTLDKWLLTRALQHDEPLLLFRQLLDHLHTLKYVRPGVTVLERLVVHAREQARHKIYEELTPILNLESKTFLDDLLDTQIKKKNRAKENSKAKGNEKGKEEVVQAHNGEQAAPLSSQKEPVQLKTKGNPTNRAVGKLKPDQSRLDWLKQQALSDKPRAIVECIEKLNYLRDNGVALWDFSKTSLTPNRRKTLASLTHKTSAEALCVMNEERRYPLLACFAYANVTEFTDQTLDLFDTYLAGAYNQAGQELAEFQRKMARSYNEKVYLLGQLGTIILDEGVENGSVRQEIFGALSREELQAAVAECEKLVRPLDDSYFDFLAQSYTSIRQFSPKFLAAFTFHSNVASQPLLQAVELLVKLNKQGRHKQIPKNAPQAFIPGKWRPYIFEDPPAGLARRKRKGKNRKEVNYEYYELCTLWELRQALRAGNIWVEGSRRYAKLDSYLIPPQKWAEQRGDIYELLNLPFDGAARLKEKELELEKLLSELETLLEATDGPVHIEEGQLKVSRLEGLELTVGVKKLQRTLGERLPELDLPDLLVEVDEWTGFLGQFVHAATGEAPQRGADEVIYAYAALLAQATNVGQRAMTRMADVSKRKLG